MGFQTSAKSLISENRVWRFFCILTPPAPTGSLLQSMSQSITRFWLVLRFLLVKDTLLLGVLMRLSNNCALQEQRFSSNAFFWKFGRICALTRVKQYTSCACETSQVPSEGLELEASTQALPRFNLESALGFLHSKELFLHFNNFKLGCSEN